MHPGAGASPVPPSVSLCVCPTSVNFSQLPGIEYCGGECFRQHPALPWLAVAAFESPCGHGTDIPPKADFPSPGCGQLALGGSTT